MSITELELAPDEEAPVAAPDVVYADSTGMLWLDLGGGRLLALDYWVKLRLARQYPTVSLATMDINMVRELRPMVAKGAGDEGQGAAVPD